jgi:hypothetical protein
VTPYHRASHGFLPASRSKAFLAAVQLCCVLSKAPGRRGFLSVQQSMVTLNGLHFPLQTVDQFREPLNPLVQAGRAADVVESVRQRTDIAGVAR